MESPKKSIDNLKDQEIDGQNVKGGFTFVHHQNGIAHYTVDSIHSRDSVMAHAKENGFQEVKLTESKSGKTTGVRIG